MASASITTTAVVTPGAWRRPRIASTRSRRRMSIAGAYAERRRQGHPVRPMHVTDHLTTPES